MDINYQDNNLIVMYLQIFLKDYFNTFLQKKKPYVKEDPEESGNYAVVVDEYEIINNQEIEVTGYWNVQSYTSLALYMAYNYPNEGYPMKWIETSDNEHIAKDYIYTGNQEELIEVIVNNIESLIRFRGSLMVPERVLSYIFDEVVNPQSADTEILRVRKLLGEDFDYTNALIYDDGLLGTVKDLQCKFISRFVVDIHSIEEVVELNGYLKHPVAEILSVVRGGITLSPVPSLSQLRVGDVVQYNTGNLNLPDPFKAFKVTGYVDPWTEWIIKGGTEVNE